MNSLRDKVALVTGAARGIGFAIAETLASAGATVALNGSTMHGRKSGDWAVHAIGHQISYLFDWHCLYIPIVFNIFPLTGRQVI